MGAGMKFCAQCGDRFTAKDQRRLFCSPECQKANRAESATFYVNKRRATDHAAKINRTAKAILKYRNSADWKIKAAFLASVTKNFITYAIRRGELRGPQ